MHDWCFSSACDKLGFCWTSCKHFCVGLWNVISPGISLGAASTKYSSSFRHCCQVRSNVKYVIQSKNRLDFKSVGTTQFNLVGCANSTRFLSGRAPWSEAAISKPGKFYGFMLKLQAPHQGVKTKPQLLYLFCMQNKIQRNRNALQNSPKEQSKLKPDKLDEPNMDLSWIPGKNLNTHTATLV